MFLRSVWYVAAWPHEVTDKPVARTLLGQPVVLFRDRAGKVGALEDRCAHRNMPLSMGTVQDGCLVCPYHGLRYDATGKCVHVPQQDMIPRNAVVKHYRCVEQDGAIWIWMGPADKADPSAIVRYPTHNPGSGWAHKPGYNHVAAAHDLIAENLLDLTHIGYVHGKTIGGDAKLAAANARAVLKVTREGEHVKVRRYLPNSPPPPTYVKAVGFKGMIDRWMEIDFHPAFIQVYAGANDAGRGVDEAGYNDAFGARIFNGVTPETEHTTHYFWSAGRNFHLDNAAVGDLTYGEVNATFAEDKVIIEAQYARMRQFPGAHNISLISDQGALEAHRLMKTFEEKEKAA